MKTFYHSIELFKKYFIGILSCLLIGFAIYYSASVILIKIVEQSLTELAAQGANIVERELENQLFILETIAKMDTITDPSVDTHRILEILKEYDGGSKHLKLRLIDENGNILSDTNEKYNISERKYFQKAHIGISNVSDPLTNIIDGTQIIVFAVPVYNGDQVKYVLSSTYQMEGLSEIIANITFLENGDAFIVDSRSILIAHYERLYVETQFNIFQALKNDQRLQRLANLAVHMIKGETGAGQYYFNGMEKYLGYTHIKGTTWSIAVAAPKSEVFYGVNKMLNLILISLAALFIALIIINTYFYYLKRHATKLQAMSRSAIDVASIVIIKIDYNGRITEFNENAQIKLGYSKAAFENGISIYDFLDKENADKLDSIISKFMLGIIVKDFELAIKAMNGEIVYFLFNINKPSDGDIEDKMEVMGIDLTERVRSEKLLQEKHDELTSVYEELAASEEELKQQLDEIIGHQQMLRESEERYSLVVEASGIGIWDLNVATNDLYISKQCKEMMGYKNNMTLNGMNIWKNQIHADDREMADTALSNYLNGTTPFFEMDYRVMNSSGGYNWVHTVCKALWGKDGRILRVAGAHTNITQKKRYEAKITKLAYFDSLTGLYNKSSIMERFSEMVASGSKKIALFFMDLDNFKLTNDSYGHAVGDQLLIQIADTLMDISRGINIVSRFGGDEFVILYPNFENNVDVDSMAEKLVRYMDDVFKIHTYSINVSCSIGIAVYPSDAGNFDELLKNADTAMYKAKEKGKNRYEFYHTSMNEAIYEKLYMQSYMKKAISKGEFTLHYQPLFTAKHQKLIGFEALLRWKNSEMGEISPVRFIPVAEETRLIIPIGEWVLRNACEFLKTLHDIGSTELTMSINISILQLQQPDFANKVLEVLEQNNLRPESLELEITESVLIQYIDKVAENIAVLKKIGIKITLDDFGTGYSSLNYLTQLPISTLKIDRSFIERIGYTEDSKLIIEPIIFISKKMGLITVAEGVETRLQLEYLQKLDCDVIQGFLLGRPQPEECIIELVKKEQKENGYRESGCVHIKRKGEIYGRNYQS